MSRAERSVAMTQETDRQARAHLLRTDGDEDVCFALWRASRGATRTTALIERLILPRDGDRKVHGNASFEARFLERAMIEAAASGAGLALLHSHPLGRGWQGMSREDVAAEQGNAGAVFGATNLPLVGLTLAGDGAWSARFWERTAPHTYPGAWCATVRVVGNTLRASFNNKLAPIPKSTEEQVRTISAWGEESQAHLVRLRAGVVGAGSVAGPIAESLVRTGFEDVSVIDFDTVKLRNLDRLNYAIRRDVGRLKVDVLAGHLRERATAASFQALPIAAAVYEEEGYRAALDCDLLFSCVDRPWGRYTLNQIAYSHLVPVIDGGILVRANRLGKIAAADWRAHVATPGRPCLLCLGQYDPGHVQLEREGVLDDPRYIEGLPRDHPLKARENVFALSMACASQQMLQMLALVLNPLDRPNSGSQLYHFVGGYIEEARVVCHAECLFPSLTGLGDSSGIPVTGIRPSNAGEL
jgi:hypothetical protein